MFNNDDYYLFECPHCGMPTQCLKKELNCTIFRCGIYKNNYQQINPHLSKEECDRLYKNNLIYGCGKPYKYNKNSELVEICGYI